MKIMINQKALVEALKTLKPAIDNRQSMPMLSDVLITCGNTAGVSHLVLASTNLELSMRYSMPADQYQADSIGQVVVNLPRLLNVVTRMQPPGDGHITLEYLPQEKVLQVTCGKMIVKMPGIAPEGYPEIRKVPVGSPLRLLIQRKALADAINRTLPFVSRDETRINLSGAYTEVLPTSKSMTQGGIIRMVGSDGHVLSLCEKPAIMRGDIDTKNERVRIIPAAALAAIPKQQKGFISFIYPTEKKDEKNLLLWITGGNWEMGVHCIGGEFPNYAEVISKDQVGEAVFDPEEMLSILSRFQAMVTSNNRGLKMDIDEGRLTLTYNHPEWGTATESMLVNHMGEPHQTGVSHTYLTQALKAFVAGERPGEDLRVVLSFLGEMSPMVMSEEGGGSGIIVIMPMKIK